MPVFRTPWAVGGKEKNRKRFFAEGRENCFMIVGSP